MMTAELTPEEKLMARMVHTMDHDVPPLSTKQPAKHPLAGRTKGVRSTSRNAFFGEVKPELGDRQRQVYVALQMAGEPLCNQAVAEALHWPINAVTPRTNELVEMGKVEEAYRDIYGPTNRRVIFWQVVKAAE